jgi:outer membrane protein assembly factor BamB
MMLTNSCARTPCLRAIAICGLLVSTAGASPAPPADEIIRRTGVSAGLAVVVGTTDGALEAELTNGGKMLVQGLALSDAAATKARQLIFGKKLYGLASVSVIRSGRTLPYYDRIVNLLVADLDALGQDAPSPAEIDRVLGYEGVAYLKQGGNWVKKLKPTPHEVDSWGHARHSASRNNVSKDLLVAPPNAVRWLGGLAGATRLDGPRISDGVFIQYAPEIDGVTAKWAKPKGPTYLWARDVNSGVLLWRRVIAGSDAGPSTIDHTGFCLGDLFVASRGRVYTYNLADDAPVAALTAFDIRTGEIVKVYDKTIVFKKTVEPRSKRSCWPRELAHQLWSSTVAVEEGQLIQLCDNKLFVMDAASGNVLWKLTPAEGAAYVHVVAGDGMLIALRGKPGEMMGLLFKPTQLECYRLQNGEPLWTFKDFEPDLETMADLFGLSNGYLPLVGCSAPKKTTTVMLDARKGSILWKKQIGEGSVYKQRQFHGLIVGDKYIAQMFGWWGKYINLYTGEPEGQFSCGRNRGCSGNAATPNYYIMQRMFHPIRQAGQATGAYNYYALRAYIPWCAEAVNPAYGSVFCNLSICFCEAFLPGGPHAFYVVRPVQPVADNTRLEAGRATPALAAVPRQTAQQTAIAALEWKAPANLYLISRRIAGTFLLKDCDEAKEGRVWDGYRQETTPAVSSDGVILTAYVHEHRLAATRDGRDLWNFVAGGRISAAPVLHEQKVLFGSHDGYVYAVNVNDGSLAWRFLAAPADKRQVVIGQVESAWPVFNVVLDGGKLYAVAGRHGDLDGGIHVFCLDPKTGAVQWHVKYVRGLTTEKHTPLGGKVRVGKNVEPGNTYALCDRIALRGGKVLLRAGTRVPDVEIVLADIADPKDTIINPETLVPPLLPSRSGK